MQPRRSLISASWVCFLQKDFAGILVDIYLSNDLYEIFFHGLISAHSHIFDKFGKVVLYHIVSDDVDARMLRLRQ